MNKKALIVLVVDHDTYAAEADGFALDDAVLLSFGQEANDMASHWLGYEAWMIINNAPTSIVRQLGDLNLPLPGDN